MRVTCMHHCVQYSDYTETGCCCCASCNNASEPWSKAGGEIAKSQRYKDCYQSEEWYTTFHVKMSFHSHANKIHRLCTNLKMAY